MVGVNTKSTTWHKPAVLFTIILILIDELLSIFVIVCVKIQAKWNDVFFEVNFHVSSKLDPSLTIDYNIGFTDVGE